MKKYWFYGTMPIDAVEEKNLTEDQKKIIEKERKNLTKENLEFGWVGFLNNNDKWEFMRHGFETIVIDESRGNIARNHLKKSLKKIFLL